MTDAERDEADHRDEEGEVLHFLYRRSVMDGDVDDPGHVAGQQRNGDRYVQQHIGQRAHPVNRKGLEQQEHREGDEKISKFICLHENHIL